MQISKKAFDLIVNEETGGESYYNKTEIHPDYPGGASGVTIGIGYDCGYSTAAQIKADWGDKLSADMITHLQACAGIHGTPAHALVNEIKHQVSVPWIVALDIFKNRDVPKWEAIVEQALPNTSLLSPDSFGALVSLAFNRGASFDLPGPRYAEMRAIKQLMANKEFTKIPDQIRSMARLWPNVSDLRNRRAHEAALFEEGLVQTA